LIFGISGLLGSALSRHLSRSGRQVSGTVFSHPIGDAAATIVSADLANSADVARIMETARAHAVIFAAGLTDVDRCERDPVTAFKLHADVPAELAAYCRTSDSKFVYISTDHLWAGTRQMVSESEPTAPINVYARSKAEGERRVLEADPSALIIRTNFFGQGQPWRQSLSDWMIAKLCGGEGVRAFTDSYFTPIHLDHLAPIMVDLIECSASGIFHVAGRDRISKFDFAQKLCKQAGLSLNLVKPGKLEDANLIAPRPHDMSLSTEKITNLLVRPMPTIDDGIAALKLGVWPTNPTERSEKHDGPTR
jgi:dTDP-4-dehydrorhamnose reductase